MREAVAAIVNTLTVYIQILLQLADPRQRYSSLLNTYLPNGLYFILLSPSRTIQRFRGLSSSQCGLKIILTELAIVVA